MTAVQSSSLNTETGDSLNNIVQCGRKELINGKGKDHATRNTILREYGKWKKGYNSLRHSRLYVELKVTELGKPLLRMIEVVGAAKVASE